MKKSEALHHLQTMMRTIQRIRSISDENGTVILDGHEDESIPGLSLTEEQASDAWKYVWGKNSILPILSKMLDNDITPMDFYNMMVIATRLEPMIGTAAGMTDSTFPEEANIQWLRGWEKEV